MLRFSVLASSSKGNATVISCGETSVLIDCGISATRIRKGLAECELDLSQISGIFITHEHTDHVCGLGQLSKKGSLPIYCTRYLARDLREMAPTALYTYLEPGSPVTLGELTVTPFSVSHDAADPVGYLFEGANARLGYVTDTGRITRGMCALLSGLDALYLESNYDPMMLEQSSRPRTLIQRIRSNWGHLSNEQACEFVCRIGHAGLKHLVLAHLSQECNTPNLAFDAMQNTLATLGLSTELHCAHPCNRLPWIEL